MDQADIRAAAFRIWGKEMFMNTSLASLAAGLGVSKAALYRHFSSKEALLESMLDEVVDSYQALISEAGTASAGTDLHDCLAIQAEAIFGFHAGFEGSLYFVAHFLFRDEHPFQKKLFAMYSQQAGYFIEALKFTSGSLKLSGIPAADLELYITVMFTQLFFYCEYYTGSFGQARRIALSEAAVLFADGLCDGFMTEADIDSFDISLVEDMVRIGSEDLPPLDRRLAAVLEVITSEGYEKASIRKIAGKMNISASSLYSFFKNKNDLFARTLEEYRLWMCTLADTLPGRFESGIQQIYVYLYALLQAFLAEPRMAGFLNWMRFRSLHPRIEHPGACHSAPGLIEHLIHNGSIRTHGLDPDSFDACLRIQVVRDIVEGVGLKRDPQQIKRRFRLVFRLLAFGINQVIRDEEIE